MVQFTHESHQLSILFPAIENASLEYNNSDHWHTFGLASTKLLKGSVINFSRSHTNELTDIGVETIKGDITNKDDIDKALNGIDVIFNVASKVGMWGKWDDFYKINFEGTKNLVDLAKKIIYNTLFIPALQVSSLVKKQ